MIDGGEDSQGMLLCSRREDAFYENILIMNHFFLESVISVFLSLYRAIFDRTRSRSRERGSGGAYEDRRGRRDKFAPY